MVDRRRGCWLWVRHRNQFGYGVVGGDAGNAHRVAYEALVGPVPVGLELDHRCRVAECCNPRHLEPVNVHENRRRARAARIRNHKRGAPRYDRNWRGWVEAWRALWVAISWDMRRTAERARWLEGCP